MLMRGLKFIFTLIIFNSAAHAEIKAIIFDLGGVVVASNQEGQEIDVIEIARKLKSKGYIVPLLGF
jgi:hypothetical protein